MSWRDKLQPASFRGVPFYVESLGMEFGRRAFSAEYPYRDNPFVDDMGRRIRTYALEAFLIEVTAEDDLFAQRNQLIEALESAGPAMLIHPRFGSVRVQVDRAHWRSEKREGNVEHFTIDLLEAKDDAQPQVETDTADALAGAADAADEANEGFLDRVMAIKDKADHVVAGAIADVNRGMAGIQKLVRIGTAAADTVASIQQTIDGVVGDITNLIQLPRTLAGAVTGLVQQVLGIDDRIDTAMSGYRAIGLLWGDAEPIPKTTPSRLTEVSNRAAIQTLFTTAAVVATARIVVQQASTIAVTSNADSPFVSADQAYAVRDELVAALDAIALSLDNPDIQHPATVSADSVDLYDAIVELQSTLVAHIEAHGQTLPRVAHVTYPQTMPVLVIAYNLDANIDREADLIDRNRIKHPLFVPSGKELEVLRG